jgi:hypothetical protein
VCDGEAKQLADIGWDTQGREKKANKLEQSGLTLEELERLQQEQFAAAAARHT